MDSSALSGYEVALHFLVAFTTIQSESGLFINICIKKGKMICRLLIIEDDRRRIQLFQEWLPADFIANFVKSARIAIDVLEKDADKGKDKSIYAGICLDHDLQMQTVVASDRELSGTSVVKAIIQYIRSGVPILIHSRNQERSTYMAFRLIEKGFDVLKIPMDQLDQKRFQEWLEEVRENWIENLDD